ncbi:MAG: hypothetical protein NXI04_13020 [Planctomycetaceae bacterium]|nr:hypothetical protein [Planctomycetaceae bacterium]
MKRFGLLSLFAFACSLSLAGCGSDEDPAPLESTEETQQLQEESASGMEEAMKKMGKGK